jgi:hypothetical protein
MRKIIWTTVAIAALATVLIVTANLYADIAVTVHEALKVRS